MSFDALATSTISTKRSPAAVSGKGGARTTHLENVKVHPIMPIETRREQEIKQRSGRVGQEIQVLQTFTEQHPHTDGGVAVNQVPDIIEGDKIIDGSDTYNVLAVRSWPATAGMTAYLELTLEEAK
jgi:hypothetical protein